MVRKPFRDVLGSIGGFFADIPEGCPQRMLVGIDVPLSARDVFLTIGGLAPDPKTITLTSDLTTTTLWVDGVMITQVPTIYVPTERGLIDALEDFVQDMLDLASSSHPSSWTGEELAIAAYVLDFVFPLYEED